MAGGFLGVPRIVLTGGLALDSAAASLPRLSAIFLVTAGLLLRCRAIGGYSGLFVMRR